MPDYVFESKLIDKIEKLMAELEDYKTALMYIHDWAALGGEQGEQPDQRIMELAGKVLDRYK